MILSGLSQPTRLSPVDLAIVAAYLIGITLFGLRFSRRGANDGSAGAAKSLKSYFLADNTIPWWAIALSIVSAETSTLTIVSIPGVAFNGNLGFLQVVVGYMLGRIAVAALFLPRYFRGEMLTAYQLIDRRFGAVLHKVTAGLFLATRAAAEGVRVFAISIVVSLAIGTGDTLSIGIISALTLLYTFEGGMAAVIWTDVVQMGLYVAGTLVALFTLGAHVPGGWTHIHEVAAPLGKFHWLDFSLTLTKSYTFWAGVLGGTFLTMASHGTDQLMVQRMLAARNLRESQLALLSSGGVIFLQFTLFLLIGVGLFVFYGMYPAVFKTSDHIFPTFIVREMPHGIAGLLIAAILAAAMSNLSAALNSLASTTVIDFYVPLRRAQRKDDPQANTGRVSRLATIFWAIVLFAIAVYSVQHGGKGHVVETGLSIAAVAYGSLLGVFLLGTLTKYATQTGTIIGMIVGFAVNLYLWQGTFPAHIAGVTIPHIAFTWYVLIGSIVTFAVGSLASLFTPRRTVALATILLLGINCPMQGQAKPANSSGARSQGHDSKLKAGRNRQSSRASAQVKEYDFAEVDRLIGDAIAAHKLPGAVVVVGHAGRTVYERSYGNRALEPSIESMTEDTIFDMASLTKVLVTSTATLQLNEQHKLSLDDAVVKYLPEFAVNGKDKITIRELLTHYSGLPEDVDLKDDWGLTAPDKAEGIRRAMTAVPYGPPGTTFKYSDINFITLGALVEKMTGQTLDSYAFEHIFKPLGMRHSNFNAFCNCRRGYLPPYGHGTFKAAGTDFPESCTNNVCVDFTGLENIAPTARDDQGTAANNPDFDRILRGVVHDPTTRRMGGVAGHAGVFSTAHDASLFAQALLDKLLRNTGPFPLTQASLKLATSANQPAAPQVPLTPCFTELPCHPSPPSAAATIFKQDGTTTTGIAVRGLGWDINSAFSRPRGTVFPLGTSFGHTGFTGTSMWFDPTSDTYVILLANAIHPRVSAPISTLRGEVATAAAKALNICPALTICDGVVVTSSYGQGEEHSHTLTGIDVLEQTHFATLEKLAEHHQHPVRIGLLSNSASLDVTGRRTADVLAKTLPEGLKLTTLYSPEHGLSGMQDTEHLAAETDAATHLPVISLYGVGAARHPSPSQFTDIDVLIIDLQDAGVRFWTYETLVGYLLETLLTSHTDLVILDRPNPLGGEAVQGQTSDLAHGDYTNYLPVPLRHGLTIGELARYFKAQFHACDDQPGLPGSGSCATLTVVPLQNWRRADYFGATGLAWTPPSPNLRSARAAILYPGVGLVEQTNVSVGRGTATPFETLGAPWIDAAKLAAYLEARHITGVRVTASSMTIGDDANHYPFHGQTIPAVHFEVINPAEFDSPEFGVELLSALQHLFSADFKLNRARALVASAETMSALETGKDPREIARSWQAAIARFRAARAPFLLY